MSEKAITLDSVLSMAAQSSFGVQVIIDTSLGSFTIDPSTGASVPGNDRGENGAGELALTILKLLNLRISLKTAAGVVGPVSVV